MSLIEVKGLRESFDSLDVLKDIDLTVEQGERVAICRTTATPAGRT